MSKSIIILGDIHAPFHNEKAVKEVVKAIKDIKPAHIVQIGDLYDQYAFSRFTRKNLETPERELKRGHDAVSALWSGICEASPGTKRYQILGNHDLRLIKRVQERLPEAQEIVKEKVMELYQFRGVNTIEDDRDVLKINGIAFHHGWLSKAGDHMRYLNSRTVVGHSHVGGVVYEQRNNQVIWELNAGYLADESAEPMRYRPTKVCKWTLGFGLITYRKGKPQPQFISL